MQENLQICKTQHVVNMQIMNTTSGEYADNEYNIWWNMQMSR